MLDYIRDAAEIYRQSFATIRAEANLDGLPADVARVVVRLIHTCGQVDLTEQVAYTDGVVSAAHAALDTVRTLHEGTRPGDWTSVSMSGSSDSWTLRPSA